MQSVSFIKKFYIFASTNYFKPFLNFIIMRKSDLVIVLVGCIIAAAILAAVVYFALTVNTGNAGFHGTF